MNAVNNTVFYDKSKFSTANIARDDFLYFISANYDIGIN